MKLLLILILALPMMASSAEKKADKKMKANDMSMLGKIDEKTLEAAPSTNPATQGPETPTVSKFSMSCKDANGKEFKSGEVGYDTCLNELKNRSDLSKRNSGLNKDDKKDSNAANFNYKIGE